jgi:hypothetical protein
MEQRRSDKGGKGVKVRIRVAGDEGDGALFHGLVPIRLQRG